MTDNAERFECVMEPTGTWMIWDSLQKIPAELSQAALIGLEHSSALLFCKLLNRLDAEGNDRLMAS